MRALESDGRLQTHAKEAAETMMRAEEESVAVQVSQQDGLLAYPGLASFQKSNGEERGKKREKKGEKEIKKNDKMSKKRMFIQEKLPI